MEIIVATAFATLDKVIQALKFDASDFLLKPFDHKDITLAVEKASKSFDLRAENRRLIKELSKKKNS